ncbi:MAG TPA: TetR family transcriptional regulator [Acidimicrobiales bacterium]|nr:TetR family transcriptional regulator [Acidimicrobiales bacterium]
MGDRQGRPGRVALMRIAVGLMGERGYDGTSTRDIAAAADVSVAALYYHFPSKLDLLREFLHEAHDVVLARLAREIECAGPDPRARLDAAVAALLWSNLHDDWAQLAAQVAWREHGRLDEPDRRKIVAKREQMVDLVEQVLRAGGRDGTFTTPEPREVARAVLTLCTTIVEPYAAMSRSLPQAVALYQGFAATLAGA